MQWVCLVAFVGCIACGASQSGTSTQSGTSGEGAEACNVSKGEKITEVISPKYGYGVMLPGTEWQLECDQKAPLSGSWNLMHMTIDAVDAELASLGERERLEKLLEILQGKNQENGLAIVDPKIEKTENKLTLSYELKGPALDEAAAKSAHVFATITPNSGRALLLHFSFTGPEAEWKPNMDQLLRLLTVSFLPL